MVSKGWLCFSVLNALVNSVYNIVLVWVDECLDVNCGKMPCEQSYLLFLVVFISGDACFIPKK
jgi:hypothetical protein